MCWSPQMWWVWGFPLEILRWLELQVSGSQDGIPLPLISLSPMGRLGHGSQFSNWLITTSHIHLIQHKIYFFPQPFCCQCNNQVNHGKENYWKYPQEVCLHPKKWVLLMLKFCKMEDSHNDKCQTLWQQCKTTIMHRLPPHANSYFSQPW